MSKIEKYKTDISLSCTAVMAGKEEYTKLFGYKSNPSTLLISAYDETYAREIRRAGHVSFIATIPEFPKDIWAICGREGILYFNSL